MAIYYKSLAMIFMVSFLLLFWRLDAEAAEISRAYTFRHDGSLYSAFVITPDAPARLILDGVSLQERILTEVLIDATNDWGSQQYVLRYPNLNPAFFQQLRNFESTYGERSALIVMTRGENLKSLQILGTLRLVWPTARFPKLPSEEMFGIRFPKRRLGFSLFPQLKVANDNTLNSDLFELPRHAVPPIVYLGATWEFKQFIVDPQSPLDIAPFLIFFAEGSGMTYQLYESTGPRLVNSKRRQHQSAALPEQYVLTCDQRMVSYYSKLGFQLIWKDPIQDGNFAMKISRAKFISTSIRRFQSRPGYEILKRVSLTSYHQSTMWFLADHFVGDPFANPSQSFSDFCGRYLASGF